MTEKKRPCVFLDRDGTINVDKGYITSVGDLELIEGAADAIAALKRKGFSVIVVSNQSAIGRGMATEAEVKEVNAGLFDSLLEKNPDARLDLLLYCPHSPEDGCECRKPKTGMLDAAEGDLSCDLDRSWVVGDKISDLEFGRNLGIAPRRRILVMTGHGRSQGGSSGIRDFGEGVALEYRMVDSLREAGALILRETTGESG